MKLLQDILYKAGLENVLGTTNIAIENLSFDSRHVEPFSLFVAVSGTQVDGHQYIDKALDAGALAIVCEEIPAAQREGVTYVKVKDSAHALGIIASNFYDNPSEKIKLVGVTGTNGKTTTVTLLYDLFTSLGYKTGLLSTVRNQIGRKTIKATHTTPDAIRLNKYLADMVEEGCTHCFMEVSSHAVVQKRVTGITFAGGVFTNITHDHLDYHKTFDAYIKAKKGFFDALPETAFALVNRDNFHNEIMVQNCKGRIHTYGLKTVADFKGRMIESSFTGLQLNIDGSDIWTKLIGGFNAYNLLAVYGVGLLLGEDKMNVLTDLSKLTAVEGRFEHIKTSTNITGIVDYAHTPDALKNVLSTINDIRTGNEQVITVVGCGGDRDAAKRPEMANIACKGSDRVVITSDNPRTEDPNAIIREMEKGVEPIDFKKTLSITDRREAIKAATSMAKPGDIILVAGKGHEKYQEINGERFDFDDVEVLSEMLQMLS